MERLESKQEDMLSQLVEIAFKIGLAMLGYFAPCKPVLFGILVLVGLDWITGIWASNIEKKKISSYRMRKSVKKVGVYVISIIGVYVYDRVFFGSDLHLVQVLGAYIGLTELKSLLENASRISGKDVLREVIRGIGEKVKDR